ncbi:histone deacetylase 6-like [Centruroides sculpturatus]|uniref:histone deacetylase 6-like n=1 Tax=Centruroides sculpturatus TaxID=218467 RepID=UPI000C6D5C4D|nr:histone deacetylase 6-like [Centruroides sculpturatus]
MILSNKGTGIIYDDRMVQHLCLWDPNYPECPERYAQSLKRCKEYGLIDRCLRLPARSATEEEILSIHSKNIYEVVKGTESENDAEKLEKLAAKYDSVYFHPKTFESAKLSAGCTIELVSAILENKVKNGMAIVRPPGHHAMFDEVCGYCFFNNAALAAQHALERYKLKRILIVDWDVHHGQATQYQFYKDPRVLYFSIHRYEHGAFWPELRESNYDFIGEDQGKGFNINVPLNETGLGNGDYLAIFNNILLPIAYEYSPELVIVSSGYDAAVGCPEGEMEVTPSAYAHFIHLLKGLANGRLCVILEGGYFISSLAEGVALTLRSLLGDPCPNFGKILPPKKSLIETICNVIAVQRPYWRSLQLQGAFQEDKSDDKCLNRIRHYPKIEYRGNEKPEIYDTRDFYNVHSPERKAELELRIRQLILDTKLDVPLWKTCIAYDEEMACHQNMFEKHIEIPERIRLSYKKLKSLGLFDKCLSLKSRYATEEELLLVHSNDLIQKMKASESMTLEELTELNKEFFSFAVYINKDSYKSAKLAVGCLLETVDSVLSGQSSNGIAVIRPPGHHADYSQPAGFCIFNNVAIAAKYALLHHSLNRILIVDWDVHHGNGTQNIFYNDPRVLFISFHRYENGQFYPYVKSSSYLGVGCNEGVGYNINISWNTDEENNGMKDADYLSAFFHIIIPVAYEFNPELILVSAGFDSAEGDPLGGCEISPECYGHMVHLLKTLAEGKLIVALEVCIMYNLIY